MNGPLKPVSFKPEPQPRLSAKYEPGKRDERYWTDAEDKLLREFYPQGIAAAQAKLPGRSPTAIRAHAHTLGIDGAAGGGKKERIKVPENINELIRAGWQEFTGKERGEVTRLAIKLKVPRHWLTTRAIRLGLVIPFHKEPPWTAAELALLKQAPLHDLEASARFFRSKGFTRSATAIGIKAKKASISRRWTATLSAIKAAAILGVDSKGITSCCIDGTLKATKRGTKRLTQQGGDNWSIERADLRQYVLDNLYRIDIRKVDKFAFVDLLVRTHKKRAPWSADEDTLVKDGYARKLTLEQIADLITDAGFDERAISSISVRAKELKCRPATRSDVWTPAEDAIVRREYEAKTKLIDIVAKLQEAGFERHRNALQMRAISLGVTCDRVNYWTEEETAIALKVLREGGTHSDALAALKEAGYARGPTSMFKFAKKHGVLRKKEEWTEQDFALLRQRYTDKVSPKKIAAELGRTLGSIRSKASELNLSLGLRERWTDEENEILRNAQRDGVKLVDVPALLENRTYAAVCRQVGMLRLDFKRRKAA